MSHTNSVGGTKPKVLMHNLSKRRSYRPFPYTQVAEMWAKGRTIAQIAHAIKRVDKKNPHGDLYHSLRNFLHRMHNIGYKDESGRLRRLPHRVSRSTVRKARHAGLRAW